MTNSTSKVDLCGSSLRGDYVPQTAYACLSARTPVSLCSFTTLESCVSRTVEGSTATQTLMRTCLNSLTLCIPSPNGRHLSVLRCTSHLSLSNGTQLEETRNRKSNGGPRQMANRAPSVGHPILAPNKMNNNAGVQLLTFRRKLRWNKATRQTYLEPFRPKFQLKSEMHRMFELK